MINKLRNGIFLGIFVLFLVGMTVKNKDTIQDVWNLFLNRSGENTDAVISEKLYAKEDFQSIYGLVLNTLNLDIIGDLAKLDKSQEDEIKRQERESLDLGYDY